MASKITVYISSVSSNQEIKKHQSHIEAVLSSKKFDYETVDVTSSRDILEKMREIAGNQTALAPQICRGDTYIGGYNDFLEAVENEELSVFLKC